MDPLVNNNVEFSLEDILSLEYITLFEKMEEIDFRDTYCDQPFTYHAKLLELLLGYPYLIYKYALIINFFKVILI